MKKIFSEGYIELICGPMFAGKTEELLRIINRLKYAKIDYIIFKPLLDIRTNGLVASRNGQSKNAIEIEQANDIITYLVEHNITASVIAIDEVQFFDNQIVDVCNTLAKHKYHVILCGLDKNFKGEPFGYMPQLMVYADKIRKLTAICTKCGCDASYTQRLINGRPVDYNSELILIGDIENYEARCLEHFEVANKPISEIYKKINNR